MYRGQGIGPGCALPGIGLGLGLWRRQQGGEDFPSFLPPELLEMQQRIEPFPHHIRIFFQIAERAESGPRIQSFPRAMAQIMQGGVHRHLGRLGILIQVPGAIEKRAVLQHPYLPPFRGHPGA